MTASRTDAREFARTWSGRGYEKGETSQFWDDLLQRVLGVKDPYDVIRYEVRADNGGFIDALMPDMGVLVEQKASGVDLDKPEERQGRMVTPFEQALDYVEGFPRARQPRWIVTCNFSTFRVYDRDKWSRSELADNCLEFSLDDLGRDPSYLGFMVDRENSRDIRERKASIRAGELIGKLYDELLGKYFDAGNPDDLHALNVLSVRLVFCLYCEDAGLFPKNAFFDYLRQVPPQQMGQSLRHLFRALDTRREDRDRFDYEVAAFPYVNGGLFSEDTPIPPFDVYTKNLLLANMSEGFDWSDISPTIFGGIFESTLNPEARRHGGMHYTSPENIHKVIDPLFLDDLRARLRSVCDGRDPETGRRIETIKGRRAALAAFHEEICGLHFLDPACGSGNFLTETYRCLRALEDDCAMELSRLDRNVADGQMNMVFEGETVHVSLDQFAGIEVNDFACRVAKTALWIAKLQADEQGTKYDEAEVFPLHEAANIVQGNALRIDWSDAMPADRCDYIMGNPPFVGSSNCSAEQKEEVVALFGKKVRRSSSLDYVSGWFYKAAEMMSENRGIAAAFVSTNSVTFGEQVYPIWNTLSKRFGCKIRFAWRTFVWNNEATDQAHVHVVVIGFDCGDGPVEHHLFDSEGTDSRPSQINAYLIDAPNVIIESRSSQISSMPRITLGCKPSDGGNYVFTEREKGAFVSAEPESEKYFHPFMGSRELINGKVRYCLYLGDADPSDLLKMPLVMERVRAVRDFRLASSALPTRKMADKPTHFFFEAIPSNRYVAIPEVSSQRRRYIPAAFLDPCVISSNKLWIMPDGGLYEFGIVMSQAHNAWMRVVTGRLKSDYQYSGAIVYNNFVWPRPAEPQRREIESCAQAVLDARAKYQGSSLADMYDPNNDFLFPDLIRAHRELDAAVEAAYGVDFKGDEERIVAHLFGLYAEMTAD